MLQLFSTHRARVRMSAVAILTGMTLATGLDLFGAPPASTANGDGRQPPLLVLPAPTPPVPQPAPTFVVPQATALKDAPILVKPPVPMPPREVKPVEPLPSPPSSETVPVKPRVTSQVKPPVVAESTPPTASNGPWKILVRPQVYKAADPWEYVRTGQVTWSADVTPAQTANSKPTTAAGPGEAGSAMYSGPHGPPGAASGVPCAPSGYQAAYQMVPFNRAEYEANPSYRHDSAMELMFGTLRPTTIVKQNQPYFSRYPDMFRYRHSVYPYLTPGSNTVDINQYWNYNGYW